METVVVWLAVLAAMAWRMQWFAAELRGGSRGVEVEAWVLGKLIPIMGEIIWSDEAKEWKLRGWIMGREVLPERILQRGKRRKGRLRVKVRVKRLEVTVLLGQTEDAAAQAMLAGALLAAANTLGAMVKQREQRSKVKVEVRRKEAVRGIKVYARCEGCIRPGRKG